MADQLSPALIPSTLQDAIDTGWIIRVREAVASGAYEIRCAPHDLSVQARRQPDIGWAAIMTPRNGTQWESVTDRDAVVAQVLA